MTLEEITDVIYDTLMENKDKPYEALDLSKVENQEVDADGGLIMFDYKGMLIKIDISFGRRT